MFLCDVCGSVTAPGTPCNRVTVETRDVEYPKRKEVHWHPPRPGKEKGKWVDDPGGYGHEIVREVRACPNCVLEIAARARAREGDEPGEIVSAAA